MVLYSVCMLHRSFCHLGIAGNSRLLMLRVLFRVAGVRKTSHVEEERWKCMKRIRCSDQSHAYTDRERETTIERKGQAVPLLPTCISGVGRTVNTVVHPLKATSAQIMIYPRHLKPSLKLCLITFHHSCFYSLIFRPRSQFSSSSLMHASRGNTVHESSHHAFQAYQHELQVQTQSPAHRICTGCHTVTPSE